MCVIRLGTVAVVSLLTGSVVAKFYVDGNGPTSGKITDNVTSADNSTVDPFEDMNSESPLSVQTKLGIVMTISLLVGLTQVSTSHDNYFILLTFALEYHYLLKASTWYGLCFKFCLVKNNRLYKVPKRRPIQCNNMYNYMSIFSEKISKYYPSIIMSFVAILTFTDNFLQFH